MAMERCREDRTRSALESDGAPVPLGGREVCENGPAGSPEAVRSMRCRQDSHVGRRVQGVARSGRRAPRR